MQRQAIAVAFTTLYAAPLKEAIQGKQLVILETKNALAPGKGLATSRFYRPWQAKENPITFLIRSNRYVLGI